MIRSARLIAPIAVVFLITLVAGSSQVLGAAGPQAGVYRGAHNPAGIAAFERWLGRSIQYALDFVPADNWRTISNPGGMAAWAPTKARPKVHKLVLGVPLIPYSGGSLQAGAAGEYDRHFRALASKLQRLKLGTSILRLGWEFSGGWYPWSVRTSEDAVLFAQYWRRVVTAMRAVAPRLQFDWNPAHGWAPFDVAAAYPGSAYVDYIGLDVYDQGWIPNPEDAVARWNDLVTGAGGLAWHRDLARSKGKPMSFPEWGIALREDGHGGGDDPYFVEQMHQWISSNRVAYQIYFEFDAPDGAHALMTGRFPNAAAAFRSTFGAAD